MQPQSMGDEQQVTQLHLLAGFHALDRAPVDAGRVSQGLLSHALLDAPHADAVADGPAGLGDPVGQIGWHPSNALPTKIISQQQI